MKVGTGNPLKTGFAVALAAIALLLVARTFLSNPISGAPAVQQPHGRGAKVESLDPTLKTSLLKSSEDTMYRGEGRNIFRAQAEPPKELPKPVAPVVQPQVPQGPPPPPPINLKFYGFASRQGEPKKIFLSQGDDIFVAGEGDIVNRRYKVIRINPTSVEIEDVLSNNRQSIPLTQG